jgi:hypothetical protein
LSATPSGVLDKALGYRGLEMHAVGLDKFPEHRVAYVLPVEMASLFTEMPGMYLYEPLTMQLQDPE